MCLKRYFLNPLAIGITAAKKQVIFKKKQKKLVFIVNQKITSVKSKSVKKKKHLTKICKIKNLFN